MNHFRPYRQNHLSNGKLIIQLKEFLKQGDTEVEWVVDKLIPKGGITILAAKPKVGKTILTFNMAICVSVGQPFLGYETLEGPVIIIQMEDTKSLIRTRLYTMTGVEDLPIYLNNKLFSLEGNLDELKNIIEQIQPQLVIFDPMVFLLDVTDENNAMQIAKAMKPLRDLAIETNTAILIVHHHRKGVGNDEEAIRGSSAIFGSVDMAINIFKEANGTTKMRIHGRMTEQKEIIIKLDTEILWWESIGEAENYKEEQNKNELRNYLNKVEKASIKEIVKGMNISETQVRRIISNMPDEISYEEIKCEGAGRPTKYYYLNSRA